MNLLGIQDYEQGIVIAYGKFTRLHLFRAANHHEIVQNIVQAANQHMNIALKVVPSQITLNKFEQEKFGPYSYVWILHLIFIWKKKLLKMYGLIHIYISEKTIF